MDFDKRAEELFLDIPESPSEPDLSSNIRQAGKLVFIAGVLPWKDARMAYKGRLGLELNLDAGKAASHAATLQALGILRHFLDGSFNKVKQIVSVRGFVAASGEFKDHHKVLDGASQLLLDLFGANAGKCIRTAVGISSLPFGAAVELEIVVELR